MKLVIEALKRQIRLEEAAITANKIERDSRKQLPGWKGSPMHPERPEYIEELKKAISILESEDSEDAIAFVEWMRAYEYFDTITKDGKSVDIWVADNCRPHPQYTTKELYQIFKSQS